MRTYAPARQYGFAGFSPYTRPDVIDVAEGIPFAALTLYASLERFDWRLLHAAVDLGASPMRAIANTLVPQMRLAMVTAGIFVFIPMLGEYLAPAAIGGTNGVMMGNLVANFFSGYLLPLGSAASVLIALVILIVLILFRRSLDTRDIYG